MSNVEITMPSATSAPPPGASSTTSTSKVNKEFASSLKGILRAVEMIFSLVAFICSTVGRNNVDSTPPFPNFDAIWGGGSWCMFVSMFSFLLFLLTYFLWLFNVLPKLTPKIPVRFIEFVSLLVFSLFYLISGIISATFGSDSKGLAAAAFFNFLMMCLCAGDGFFHYREWSGSDEGPWCGGGGSFPSSPARSGNTGGGQAYPTTGHPQSGDAPKY